MFHKVSLLSGISVSDRSNRKILCYDESKEGIVDNEVVQYNLEKSNMIRITFEDGSIVECPENYKYLSDDNRWIESDDLIEQRIQKSVCGPITDYKPVDWKLDFLSGDNKLVKHMAFFRILGLLITDGSVCKNRCVLFSGHPLDVDNILNDLYLLTDQRCKVSHRKHLFYIYIPSELSKNILSIKGVSKGRRVIQNIRLPDVIMDQNCPLVLVREFIGGMFGGDGHCPVLTTHSKRRKDCDQITSVSFSQTKTEKCIDSLYEYINDMKILLCRLGINDECISIQKHKETTLSKFKTLQDEMSANDVIKNEKHYQITLQINVSQLILFHDNIGFRYCCHKSQRLEAAVSYRKLREKTSEQTRWVVERVRELSGYIRGIRSKISLKKCVEQAHNELKECPIYNEYYSLPTYEMVRERLKRDNYISENLDKMKYEKFPTAEEYLRSIDAYKFFQEEKEYLVPIVFEDEEDTEDVYIKPKTVKYGVHIDRDSIPTFNLKVIHVLNIGMHQIYTPQISNFLSNGVVCKPQE